MLDAAARSDRLADVGERTASVVHDLRNPLAVIETSTFVIAERAGDSPRIAEHAKRIAAQIDLARAIIADLLDATRAIPLGRVNTGALIRRSLAQFSSPLGARVSVHPDPESVTPTALGDARRLQQVLVNLLQNAFDAMGDCGTVAITTTTDGSTVTITVHDQGPGLADAVLPLLFEPLFTTKHAGVGLGLSSSRRIARAAGGDLIARNHADGGACFELTLPSAPDESADGAAP